jgi:hypothetical protein
MLKNVTQGMCSLISINQGQKLTWELEAHP